MNPLLLLGIGVGAVALFKLRNQQPESVATFVDPVETPVQAEDVSGATGDAAMDVTAYLSNADNNVTLNDKLAAFLQMIRFSEHAMNDVLSGQDYYTVAGSTPSNPIRFTNIADHPAFTGEWAGLPRSDDFCIRAGFGNNKRDAEGYLCRSYAAGAYQLTKTTWNALRKRAPRLPDFSPASQDEAALRLLREIGVPQLLNADRFEDAVYAAAARWASLPSSPLPGKTRSIAQVSQWYRDGLRTA